MSWEFCFAFACGMFVAAGIIMLILEIKDK